MSDITTIRYEKTFNISKDINPDSGNLHELVFENIGRYINEPYRTKLVSGQYDSQVSCNCISIVADEDGNVRIWYTSPSLPPNIYVDYSNVYTATITIDNLRLVFNIGIRLTRI